MAAKDEETYATYKGLGYVSMFMGVPLMALLILFAIGIAGGFLFCMMFGWLGLLCPAICGVALLFLKVLCETDNKAVERMKWQLRSWKMRLSKASTILTVSPNKTGNRNELLQRSLKKIYRSE